MLFLALLLLSGFSLATAGMWLHLHILAGNADWLWTAFPLAIYGAIAGGGVLLFFRLKKTPFLSLAHLFGLFILVLFVLFNTQTFLRPIFLTGTPLLSGLGIIAANLSFGKMVFSVLLLYATLTLLFPLTGSLVLRLLRFSHRLRPALLFVIHFIVGIVTWTALLILYHWIGLLSAGALLITATAILLAERHSLSLFGRQCFQRFEPSIPHNPFNAFIIGLLLFLVAFNVSETLRPTPTGFDDMTFYMNRVALMTERHSLIDGTAPYAFELLATGIGIVLDESGQQFFALSFGAYGLLIGALFVFLLGRAYFGTPSGLIAATIFLSTPMGAALAFLETKPDSLLLPVTVAMTWFILEAYHSKRLIFFCLACLGFGLAISIKLTGAIFIPGLTIGFFLLIWKRQRNWFSVLRAALLGLIFFVLPLLPWYLHDELGKAKVYLYPQTETTLIEDIHQELWGAGRRCPFLGQTEDMLRFDPNPGWNLKEIITSPWDITMNQGAGLYATEAGFLFLALLPFGFLAFFRLPEKSFRQPYSTTVRLFVIISTGAIVLWGISGTPVIWYAYPVLPLLSILVAFILDRSRDFRIIYFFLVFLTVTGLMANTLVRMKFGDSEPRLRYAAGAISADEYSESVFPGYHAAMDILNQDQRAKILVTGSRYWYGIRENDRRAYLDTHLEAIDCLLNRYDPDTALTVLRRLGIRYILFSRSLLSEIHSDRRPTLQAKVIRFTDFAGQYLPIVWGSPQHTIFEIPSADSPY